MVEIPSPLPAIRQHREPSLFQHPVKTLGRPRRRTDWDESRRIWNELQGLSGWVVRKCPFRPVKVFSWVNIHMEMIDMDRLLELLQWLSMRCREYLDIYFEAFQALSNRDGSRGPTDSHNVLRQQWNKTVSDVYTDLIIYPLKMNRN